jgi:electron transfer flavoprotein beta subunit
MRVLVFVELGVDTRIAPELDARSRRVRAEWLVSEFDPACARALGLALDLKTALPDTEVTVAHLGPSEIEPWLRRALARGCDGALRVWDEEVVEIGAAGKAVVLAAAAEAVGFDLILAGAAGVIDSSGQFGVLLAQNLRIPCVTEATELRTLEGREELEIDRILDRGFRERLVASLPLVVTTSGAEGPLEASTARDIPASALLNAQDDEITVWDLADLGIPRARVLSADRALRFGQPETPRPRLHRIAAPDPALPAFDRILELVKGSVQVREGRVVQGSAEAAVEEVFTILKDEGWLDHLKVPEGHQTGVDDA